MASTEYTSTGDGRKWSECQICLSSMVGRKPRALSCLHTFCETCLVQLPSIEPYITCPTCRGQTKLPNDGVSGLPINFMIEQVAPKVDQVNLCQTCIEAECSYYCMDGCGRLCSPCKIRHDAIESFRKHQIKSLENSEEVSDEHCLVHGKILHLFCKKCQTCLCSICALSATHHGHEGLIVEMKNEHKKMLSNIKDSIKAIHDVCEQMLSAIQRAENHISYITQKMEDQYERIKEKLDRKRENLLGEIAELSAPLADFRSKVNSIREGSQLVEKRLQEDELYNCKRQKMSEAPTDEGKCENLQKEAEDLKGPVTLVKSFYIPRRASEIKLGRFVPKGDLTNFILKHANQRTIHINSPSDISVRDKVRVKTYCATKIEHLRGKIGKVSGIKGEEYVVDFSEEINVRCVKYDLEVVHD